MPSAITITNWLKRSELPLKIIRQGVWQIQMSHRYCDYTLTITSNGNWFSFGADLIGNAVGGRIELFYQKILELNSRLNGVHIAMDNKRIVLLKDDYNEDLSEYSLYRTLDIFHESHEYVYSELLKLAKQLNIQIRN